MRKNNPKDNGIKMPFDDIDFINKWQEWLLYRQERRLAKYVPRGLKATFTELFHLSNGDPKIAIAIINQSMAMNWQGLFALKNTNNGKSTNPQQNLTDDNCTDALHRFINKL